MEQELVHLKRKFDIIKSEKDKRDQEYREAKIIKDDPEGYINTCLKKVNQDLEERNTELARMKRI